MRVCEATERMRHVQALNANRVERLDTAWAAGQVDSFPAAWADKLLARWRHKRPIDAAGANLDLLKTASAIGRAHRSGVPADANDGELRQEASTLARDTARRLDTMRRAWEHELADREPAQRDRLLMLASLLEVLHWSSLRGVAGKVLAHARRHIPGAVARTRCERFWRGVLRGIHATAVEATARTIGLVHKRAGCYVSQETLHRRLGQRKRNEAALESVVAVNEHGQDYTLAELAAKGPANRAIRRMELMTRIAGFELIAKECGHEALFVTVTCPSRMHAWRTRPGQSYGVEPNPKHDGTQPDQAQAYLCRQWRSFSEACRRSGVELYGFRIAEPNHDGTPHWHALLFFPPVVARGTLKKNPRAGRPVALRVVLKKLRQYFLHNDSAAERGARRRRVVVERIDWARGSAAGYIAKYVAKNIDGYRVEKDLYGNDTMTSSLRVDAWASTWRIRQFQQIGGAPVGVWRELRRLHPDQADTSPAIAMALDAVNVTAGAVDHEWEAAQRYTAANGFATYLHLQGGHRVPRRELRLQVLREPTGELGRYGETMPPRAVGVVTVERRAEEVPAFGIVPAFRRFRTVRREVESERANWLVVPKGFVEQARARLMGEGSGQQRPVKPPSADGGRADSDLSPMGVQAARAARRPWSPVNNCTRPDRLFAGPVERHEKRGRWHRWETKPGGYKPEETHHGNHPHPADHRR